MSPHFSNREIGALIANGQWQCQCVLSVWQLARAKSVCTVDSANGFIASSFLFPLCANVNCGQQWGGSYLLCSRQSNLFLLVVSVNKPLRGLWISGCTAVHRQWYVCVCVCFHQKLSTDPHSKEWVSNSAWMTDSGHISAHAAALWTDGQMGALMRSDPNLSVSQSVWCLYVSIHFSHVPSQGFFPFSLLLPFLTLCLHSR